MVRFTKRYKYSRMNGGKKRRRKNKRKTRRKRGGDAVKQCSELVRAQNPGISTVKVNSQCFDPNKRAKIIKENLPSVVQPKPAVAPVVAPVVQSKPTFVDDDTVFYGINKKGNCKHLRDTYFTQGHHNKVKERCNKEAGKHCKKTCEDNKNILKKKKFGVTKNVLESRLNLKNTQNKPLDVVIKGTEGCDVHNFYDSGVFKKSEGKNCRKNSSCKLAKGKKKSSPMNTRKCIPRKGGRRKQKRKTKRKRRKKKKTKRRNMKGGSGKGLLVNPACSGFGCDMPTNVGKLMTGYGISNKMLPDPMSLNRNVKHPYKPIPMNYNKKGGRKKGNKQMKGGFFLDNWGLGDGLLSYYKGTNAALNTKHLYAGNKPEMKADPTHQPELSKPVPSSYNSSNVPEFYDTATTQAAGFNLDN